jgi:predicted CoA-binding protein
MDVNARIDAFLALKTLAVIGASRDPRKYGHRAFQDLLTRGLRVYPVNPNAAEIEGHPVFPSIADLPAGIEGLVLVVPPAETERAVRAAHKKGIRQIWMQPGAESADAVRFCEDHGLSVVHGVCLMMQASPPGEKG